MTCALPLLISQTQYHSFGVIFQVNRVRALFSLPSFVLYRGWPICGRILIPSDFPNETYALVRRWKNDKARNAVNMFQLLRFSKVITISRASFHKAIAQIHLNWHVTRVNANLLNQN